MGGPQGGSTYGPQRWGRHTGLSWADLWAAKENGFIPKPTFKFHKKEQITDTLYYDIFRTNIISYSPDTVP